MLSGHLAKGSPGLLRHPRAVGSGRGFSALCVSSFAMTRGKTAGSRVPQLLLSMQWAGPEYPTQEAEPLAVLCNVHTPQIDAMSKRNLTLWKIGNLENARNSCPSGYLLDTTKLNGGQKIPRSVTQFSCIQYIPLTNLRNIRMHLDVPGIRPRGTPRKQYTECILMQINSLTRCGIATRSARRTLHFTNQSEFMGSQCHVGIQPWQMGNDKWPGPNNDTSLQSIQPNHQDYVSDSVAKDWPLRSSVCS